MIRLPPVSLVSISSQMGVAALSSEAATGLAVKATAAATRRVEIRAIVTPVMPGTGHSQRFKARERDEFENNITVNHGSPIWSLYRPSISRPCWLVPAGRVMAVIQQPPHAAAPRELRLDSGSRKTSSPNPHGAHWHRDSHAARRWRWWSRAGRGESLPGSAPVVHGI